MRERSRACGSYSRRDARTRLGEAGYCYAGLARWWAFRFSLREAEHAALRKIPREPSASFWLRACGMLCCRQLPRQTKNTDARSVGEAGYSREGLAKIFAPCRRLASGRRSSAQMRTSSLAAQATVPNAKHSPDKQKKHQSALVLLFRSYLYAQRPSTQVLYRRSRLEFSIIESSASDKLLKTRELSLCIATKRSFPALKTKYS